MSNSRILLFVLIAFPSFVFAQGTPVEKMKDNIKAVKSENIQFSERINQQQKESEASLKSIKAEVSVLEREYKAKRSEFEKLLDEENKLSEELTSRQDEIKALEGAVRASAKEADEMIHANPVTAARPERIAEVQTMLDDDRFPGIANIRKLVDIYFHEMSASGEVVTYEGDVIAPDGSIESAEIIRLGRFVTYFKNDNRYGLLKPNEQGDKLLALSGKLPSSAENALKKAKVFPLDFSGGLMFKQFEDGGASFLSTIKAGGILVYPILGVGLIALILILERAFVLSRIKSTSGKRMDMIMEFAERSDWEGCDKFCAENSAFPTCRILKSTMGYIGETQEVIENAMQEAILRELPRMERFLPTLNILAAVAPLLGLLGTVTGMINTFNILTIFGTGDPRMMSGGISEALVTTQLGLAVAIPVMLFHHMLERRVDRILTDIEEKGTRFAVALLKKDSTRSF